MPEPARPLVERLDTLVEVLDFVRSGAARTRPEIGRASGLGRSVVSQRLVQLIEAGLVSEGELGRSTGGRAPRELRFVADVGHLLVAGLGALGMSVGVADLSGRVLDSRELSCEIAAGPETVLSAVENAFDALIGAREEGAPPIWGIGIGVPGPVEFATGRPIAPPIMPGWDSYPVRERLARRYDVPVWVDNDVNLMALGELRAGLAEGESDALYIKIGSGIGAGLITRGLLHRGAQGVAGDVGHVAITDDPSVICRCGNVGCLEAIAGGAALARAGQVAAEEKRSRFLQQRLEANGALVPSDIADAAEWGDPVAIELLARSGQLVGQMLATLVNFYNPSLVIIGGRVAGSGDLVLAAIRQAVYRRSLSLATRDIRIVRSGQPQIELRGAAWLVIDELFSPSRLARWIEDRTPVGHPSIAEAA